MTDVVDARDAALQTWLALEREAVWFYPYAGARVPDLADRARSSLRSHQVVRDRLIATVDVDRTRPEAAYDVGPVRTAAQAEKIAQRIERRVQAACVALLRASTAADDRALPLSGLRRAAVAEVTWGGSPHGFPGLD